LGYLGDSGFTNDQAVEGAVNDVADGSHKDQGEAYQDAHGGFGLFQQADNVPPEEFAQGYAEEAQDELTGFTAKDHSEGHAFIFHKKQLEPSAQNRDALVKGKVRFYPDLKDLIQDKNSTDNDGYDLASG
jgi:hypothetical protein